MIESLQSGHLFLVEVLHLIWSDYPIGIDVNDVEPIEQRPFRRLVLLTEHEPNEVVITHLTWLITLELPRDLLEDPLHRLSTQRIPFVPGEVLLINKEIVVRVQLPEPAVQNIEVLITKEVPDLVDVILAVNLKQNFNEVGVPEVSEADGGVIIRVQGEEDPHYNSVCVPVLELRCALQKIKAWMRLQQYLHH